MSNFKPLLAHTVESMEAVTFPVVASPKLDGIRCLIVDGEAVTRSLKPVPNEYIRDCLSGLPALDGELIVGNPAAADAFNVSTSGVMSRDGMPAFTYYVFDRHDQPATPFVDRLNSIMQMEKSLRFMLHCEIVEQVAIPAIDNLAEYESACVGRGYEGAMIRDPYGVYKHGRSTAKDRILGKVKRFADTEGTIIGVEELYRNENEQTRNALGHAERSTAKGGLIPADTLGALIVKAEGWDAPFKIGTGYDQATRDRLWIIRDFLIGRMVKFKHQPSGAKDAPRFPVFVGLREAE